MANKIKSRIISVKAKHIKMGNRGDSGSCPVALALKELGFNKAEVGDKAFDIFVTGFGHTFKAPRSVTRFVRNFDQHKKVKPFNFKLFLDPSCKACVHLSKI